MKSTLRDQADADPYEYYRVEKMTFARPTAEQKAAGEEVEQDHDHL